MRTSLSLEEARRVALAAQGFDEARPRRATVGHLRSTIRRLGLLQIDCVNVVCAAHYMVPFSRLGPYDRKVFDRLVYESREFAEHWAHEISIVPVEMWPLLRYRRETDRVRPWGFAKVLEERAEYAGWVLEEVRRRGKLAADDLAAPDGGHLSLPGSVDPHSAARRARSPLPARRPRCGGKAFRLFARVRSGGAADSGETSKQACGV